MASLRADVALGLLTAAMLGSEHPFRAGVALGFAIHALYRTWQEG